MAKQKPVRYAAPGPRTISEDEYVEAPGPEVPPNPCDEHKADCKCVGCVHRVMD